MANLARLECQFKPALGQINHNRIVYAFGAVVFAEFLPQPGDVHADRRLLARIVGIGLGEHVQPDRVLLETVRGSGDGFIRQVTQEGTMDLRRSKRFALKNPLDLSMRGFQL